MNKKLPKAFDVYDGKPIPRIWFTRVSVEASGRKVLATRKTKVVACGQHYDSWSGAYNGYPSLYRPLFRSLKNALRFAVAAYDAGYRIKKP